MTDLQHYEFNGTMVRTVLVDGEPCFIARDICTVLEIGNTSQAVASLDEDERGVITNEGRVAGFGPQSMTYVTEAGMYSLVLRSRKPEAKAFKRWVTHEVLPAIRRTGSYSVPAAVPALTEDEIVHQALQITAAKVEALESRVAELEPAATFAQTVLSAEGDISVGDAAKALANAGIKTGQNRLFSQLHAMGWVYRSLKDQAWRPVQTRIESGHLSVLPQSHYHPKTGELVLDPPQIRVTAHGLRLLAERLAGAALEVKGVA